jgi:hypothetical protein
MNVALRTPESPAARSLGAEALLLEPENLPEVPAHPAPWDLRASAYLLMLRMPENFDEAQAFTPPSLAGKLRGRIAYLMAVDYDKAPCGPYRELLFAPVFEFADGKHASITRIYVSTYDSVVNGRRNWGIPKDRADFERAGAPEADDRWLLRYGSRALAELEFHAFGPSLPVWGGVLPSSLRTIVQHWRGQEYRYLIKGKGSARLAKLKRAQVDASLFPELAQANVLAAFYMPVVELAFPVASVQPLG